MTREMRLSGADAAVARLSREVICPNCYERVELRDSYTLARYDRSEEVQHFFTGPHARRLDRPPCEGALIVLEP